MILVVGATGHVGGEVCRRLVASGERVRALVRTASDPAKVAMLESLGVGTIRGDLRQRATLDAACRGVSVVVATASSMPFSYRPGENDIRTTDLDGVSALIEAARLAGVRRFVYTSLSGNLEIVCPLRNAKRAIETRLIASGLDYTILRPSFFMEVWLSPTVGFDPELGSATIYGDGTRPISWISAPDVAEFAARSAVAGGPSATLELGGPEPLTPKEVIRVFERISGRTFDIQHVQQDALLTRQTLATDEMEQSLAGLMRCYALGDLIDMGRTLQAMPVTLTSVESYAERILGKAPVTTA
jgi:NADH dehydrogenase